MILDGAALAVGRHFRVHGWCVPSRTTPVVFLFLEVGMRPRDVSKVLSSLIPTRKPVYLWGSPGVGKSAVVRQAADRRKIKLIDVRATRLDPVDLRGLPKVTQDRAQPARGGARCGSTGVARSGPPPGPPAEPLRRPPGATPGANRGRPRHRRGRGVPACGLCLPGPGRRADPGNTSGTA